MELKRNQLGRITNADIRSSDTPIANFTDALLVSAQQEIILEHNTGLKMLDTFHRLCGNGNVWTVADMLKEMMEIYRDYESERFKIRRDLKQEEEATECGSL